MSSAKIVIDQSGLTAGTASKSRRDIVAATPVQLSNQNDTGIRSWRWSIVSKPSGSAAVLSSSIIPNPTFTPDVPGSYLIELKVDEGRTGQVDRRVAAVLTNYSGRLATPIRIPAPHERNEANWDYSFGATPGVPNENGWAADLIEWMDVLCASPPEFDNRATPLTTASAATGGGTADFTIDVGTGAPLAVFFQVNATSNTTSSTIQLYRDAARANLIYEATGKDCFTAPGFKDATPFALFDASNLESNTVYGRITNNGATASTYTIRLVTRR